MAAVDDLRLQTVIVADTEVHNRTDLSYASRHRQNRSRRICRGYRSDLSGRRSIERHRRIQINRSVEIGPVLMYVVCSGDKPPGQLVLEACGKNLAARIHKLIRIMRQLVEIEPVLRKLCLVERALAGNDRDVARGQLGRRQRLWVNVDRNASEAGRKPELPGNRGVSRQSV